MERIMYQEILQTVIELLWSTLHNLYLFNQLQCLKLFICNPQTPDISVNRKRAQRFTLG